jgi:hypothetical protein
MKMYKDKALKEEVTELDFGITLAGDTKEITYYLYNDIEADLVEIKATVDNTEVSIKDCPTNLEHKTSSPIVFAWKPSITLKRGLKTKLDLKYFELYG